MTLPPGDPRARARALYVEDHYESGVVVSRMLASTCDVVVCNSPEAAMERLGAESFRVILLDINLGTSDGDGIRLLRRIRQLPAHAGTPIMAVTAYALQGDDEFFLAQGFTDYLSKPVNMTDLVAKVRKLLASAGVTPP